MKSIADWVAQHLDPADQMIIANDGPDVSEILWTLTNEEEEVARDVFHRYAQDMWSRLLGAAEARGVTPLSLLDDYARRQGETICSPESFEMTALVWAIERVSFQNTFTRAGEE